MPKTNALRLKARELIQRRIAENILGQVVSYSNFQVLLYLKEMLDNPASANAIVFISDKFSAPFFSDIFEEAYRPRNNYCIDTKVKFDRSIPAMMSIKGAAETCFNTAVDAALGNPFEKVFVLLKDFRALRKKLSRPEAGKLQNLFVIAEAPKVNYNYFDAELPKKVEFEILFFNDSSFSSFISMFEEAKREFSGRKPVVIFIQSFWEQILI